MEAAVSSVVSIEACDQRTAADERASDLLSWRVLLVVLSRRLVKRDRDYRFGPSRRLLVARTPLAEQAYRRLDRHIASPGGAAFSMPRLPIGRPCNTVSLRVLPLLAGQQGDS